jgi:hypothetical protein
MNERIDLPLPADWSPRKLLRWAVGGQLLMLAVAVRWLWIPAGPLGDIAHFGTGLLFMASVFLSGTAMARCQRQATALPTAFVLGGGVLLAALACAVPPFLSNDVFDYLARGRVAVLGGDQYVASPLSMAADPRMAAWLPLTRWAQWPTPYPPLSALLQQLCAWFDSPWLAAYAWKLLMTVAFAVTGCVLAAASRKAGDARSGQRVLALWLWNPALLLELCGSGHNDAVVLLLLALMLRAAAHEAFTSAAVWFGASLLWKQGHAPIAPLLLALAAWRGQLRRCLLGAAVVAVAAVLAWSVWLRAPGALSALFIHTGVQCNSLPWLVEQLVHGSGKALAVAGLLPLFAVLLIGVHRARTTAAFAHFAVATLVLFQLLVMQPFEAWYALWWLPFAALAQAPAVARVAELLGWLLPLSYLARATSQTFGIAHQISTLLLTNVWPAVLLALEWRSLAGVRQKTTAVDADAGPPG